MSKKDFRTKSPTEAFINTAPKKVKTEVTPKEEKVEQLKKDLPEGYVIQKEKKTERTNLIFRPTLKARLKEEADKRGTSLNEVVHELLEKALDSLD